MDVITSKISINTQKDNYAGDATQTEK